MNDGMKSAVTILLVISGVIVLGCVMCVCGFFALGYSGLSLIGDEAENYRTIEARAVQLCEQAERSGRSDVAQDMLHGKFVPLQRRDNSSREWAIPSFVIATMKFTGNDRNLARDALDAGAVACILDDASLTRVWVLSFPEGDLTAYQVFTQQTSNDISGDVMRWLNGLPIPARPGNNSSGEAA